VTTYGEGIDWRALLPRDFRSDAPHQPLTLLPAPDPTGTPDLFEADQ
jgi:hypothetical protein